MLVVLEGTDGAGKSTLARALSEAFIHSDCDGGVITLTKGPPDDRHILAQYETDLEKYLPMITSSHDLVICDRWHLGEQIYGPLLRYKNRLNNAQLIHVEMLLSALGAVRIVVTADYWTLWKRHQGEPDDLVNYDQAKLIADKYDLYATMLGWDTTDTSGGISDLVTRGILFAARTQTENTGRPLKKFTSYVGPGIPDVLLVGDVPGGTPISNRAFMPVTRQGPSAVLLEDLADVCDWRKVGLVNQHGTDLKSLWVTLSCPAVVALGQAAAHAVEYAGIPRKDWREVRHPQYQHRFYRKEWPDYIRNLASQVTHDDRAQNRPLASSPGREGAEAASS